jgi:hypothetical protein
MTNPIDNSSQTPKPVSSSTPSAMKATFNPDGTVTFLGMTFTKSDWEGEMKAMLFEMSSWVDKTMQKSRQARKDAWNDAMDS